MTENCRMRRRSRTIDSRGFWNARFNQMFAASMCPPKRHFGVLIRFVPSTEPTIRGRAAPHGLPAAPVALDG